MISFYVFCAALSYTMITKANAIQIVPRSEWGARSARVSAQTLSQNPPPFVVIHHSDTPSCLSMETCKSRVKQIQSYHIDHNHWNDIGYNFLIGGDGTIFEGRGWGKHGAHAPIYNSKSIGICMIGNFQDASPPEVQVNALKDLLRSAQSDGKVTSSYELIGHRQAKSTTCPGDELYNLIAEWDHFNGSIHY